MAEANWAGNYAYRAGRLHRPTTLEQVREIVAARAAAARARLAALVQRHRRLGRAGLARRPAGGLAVDRAAGTVTVGAACATASSPRRWPPRAWRCTTWPRSRTSPSPGAVATATHGSGDANGNLATAVAGLELVTSERRALTASRGDADFDGLVVGLGALGAVTRITLDVEPAYEVRQRVFERPRLGLAVRALRRDHRERLQRQRLHALGRRDRPGVGQEPRRGRARGRRAASSAAPPPRRVDRHPIPGLDPVNCTPQLGVPGPVVRSPAALPHGLHAEQRRRDPVRVPRCRAGTRSRRSRPCAPSRDAIRPLLQVVRDPHDRRRRPVDEPAVRAGHDRHPLHLEARQAAVERALAAVEAALAPFGGAAALGQAVPRARRGDRAALRAPADFARLVERLDPRGAFRNDWLRTRVLDRA